MYQQGGKIMKYKLNWSRDVDVTDDEFILNLPLGYKFPYDPLCPTHIRGYDSKNELLADVKYVVKCDCQECKGAR
tara:strand:- start:449 stop:673 length:225 start_codon:yes stop_codon:yes gene_type:complete